MDLLISEILEKVSKIKSKKEKVTFLKHYDSDALRMVIKSSFDPKIKWALPDGEVPYAKNDAPEGTEHTNLHGEARKLFHYLEGGNSDLKQNRRESMFVQLLEGLHPDEADLLVSAKDKSLHRKYKGLSLSVVKTAFNWNDDFMVENVEYPAAPGLASG